MTIYLSNRDGDGKTNEEGHYRLLSRILEGGVLTSSDLAVTQNSPLGMSVLVDTGDYRLETSSGYSYMGWVDVATAVTITTADPSNPRISTIVAYVDKAEVTAPSPPNNPGITKLLSVDGTPSATPTAPNSTVIQTAVGAGNPYMILANVTVGAGATQITNANISDQRTVMSVLNDLIDTTAVKDNSITTAKIVDANVTAAKLASNSVTTAKILDEQVTAAKMANRTRTVMFYTRADGTGGAVDSDSEGPVTVFTGTPSSYMRGRVIVPNDYVTGTDATLRFVFRGTNNHTVSFKHYIGARSTSPGTSFTGSWNVANAVVTAGQSVVANQIRNFDVTIPSANLASGNYVVFAWHPDTAITGTIYEVATYLVYTADS